MYFFYLLMSKFQLSLKGIFNKKEKPISIVGSRDGVPCHGRGDAGDW